MSTQINHDEVFAELDEIGEKEVRAFLARGIYGQHGPKVSLVHEWLRSKESEKQDSRDEETLSMAKEANRIASKALRSNVRSERAAWIAAIAAIIAAIAAISDSSIFSSSSVTGNQSEVHKNKSPNKAD